MANTVSSNKRVRINQDKRKVNQRTKSDMRTQLKHVNELIARNDLEGAKTAQQKAIKSINKAVNKGVVHKNTGNRQKARLAARIAN